MTLPDGITLYTLMYPEDALPLFMPYLSPSQREEIQQIKLSKRRLERAAVYKLINDNIGGDLILAHLPDGAPFLTRGDKPALPYISLTHTEGFASVLASFDIPQIGVDAEIHSPKPLKIIERFASDDERAQYADEASAIRLWTIKEAVYKAAGIAGLSLKDAIRVVKTAGRETTVEVRAGDTVKKFSVDTTTVGLYTLSCAFPLQRGIIKV